MSSHYISGRNGIEYLAKSLAHSRKGTTQITATCQHTDFLNHDYL